MTEHRHTNVSTALPYLADHVMGAGSEVGSRDGERVLEVLHQHIVLERPWEREVTTPTRHASLPAQIAETVWVLSGRDDIEFLSHYLPRAADFSDDGVTWRGAYGKRLRRWPTRNDHGDVVDQLAQVVDILRADPTSRRAVMSIFDPAIDLNPGKDIPCNNWLSFQSRNGKLDLHVSTRSNDLVWGWSGINAFEWSTLQEIVAGLLGVAVGELHFTIASLHAYDRHWKRVSALADLRAEYRPASWSPRFDVETFGRTVDDLDDLLARWLDIEKMIRTGYAEVDRDIRDFPEPMLRSWLRVLRWWWTQEDVHLEFLRGTALYEAAKQTPGAPTSWSTDKFTPISTPFTAFASKLHADKSAAYGDSWKRRGEMLGIMANIARKVDRLGVSGGGDTSADTAVDLLIYLVKYSLWLKETNRHEGTPDEDRRVGEILEHLEANPMTGAYTTDERVERLRLRFEDLERAVTHPAAVTRSAVVDAMLPEAYALAEYLWTTEDSE